MRFDEEVQRWWPDTCPACGCGAYIGMNEVRCFTLESCMNFDANELQRWEDLRDEMDDTQPNLSLPTLDELQILIDEVRKIDWEF